MKVLMIQNCDIEGFGLYEQYLVDHGIDHSLVRADLDELFPPHEEFDAILIGGTPISAYAAQEYPFLLAEREFLRQAVFDGKACLGTCCGAQILAQILGAEVHRCKQMEIGAYRVRLTGAGRRDALLQDFPHHFPVFHWHGDTFSVPEAAELLVEGEVCRNQMFRQGKVVGVQFHLEATSIEAGVWADAYRDELVSVGKTSEEVVRECQEYELEMERMAMCLLDNFFELALDTATG